MRRREFVKLLSGAAAAWSPAAHAENTARLARIGYLTLLQHHLALRKFQRVVMRSRVVSLLTCRKMAVEPPDVAAGGVTPRALVGGCRPSWAARQCS
jgi:hypothetical protein